MATTNLAHLERLSKDLAEKLVLMKNQLTTISAGVSDLLIETVDVSFLLNQMILVHDLPRNFQKVEKPPESVKK